MLHYQSDVQIKQVKILVLLIPLVIVPELTVPEPPGICVSEAQGFQNLLKVLLNLGGKRWFVNVKRNDHNSASECAWESIENIAWKMLCSV